MAPPTTIERTMSMPLRPEPPVARTTRTQVRDPEARPASGASAAPRRAIRGASADDRFTVYGSMLAAFSMAWLVCYRLVPWAGAVPLFLVGFVLFVAIYAITTMLAHPGPMVRDRIASALISGGALIVGLGLFSTLAFTFIRGAEALPHLATFTKDMAGVGPRDPVGSGGVLHAIVGSAIEVGIAIAVTLPLGVGTAVFMTEVGGRLARVVRTVVEAMTALPSIVAGLFIYATLIVGLGVPRSGFAAAMAISVMMLPIIARAADVVLRVIPSGLREASLALGASRWRTVWHVVLPTARPGLATALILGIARGVGETSPVLLTSGAATFMVTNPFDGVMNSLPLFIYSTVRSGQPIYVTRAFGAAAILLGLVLALFVMARYIARQRTGR